jgi:hypothetical protein
MIRILYQITKDDFMYSIAEVSEKLKKSKTAIYDKLNDNKNLFKNYLSIKKGSKHISEEGFKILYSMFNEDDFQANLKESPLQVDKKDLSFVEMYENQKTLFENQVEYLKNQLEYIEKEKNIQIDELKKDKEFLQNQLVMKNKLIEQSNVLLLQEKNKVKESIWRKMFKGKKDSL